MAWGMLAAPIAAQEPWAALRQAFTNTGARLREAAEDANRDWRAAEHPCADCGAPIHVGERCGGCLRKRAAEALRQTQEATRRTTQEVRDEWQRSAWPCADCGVSIHLGKYCLRCHNRRAAAMVRPELEAAKRNYAAYADTHRDEWRSDMETYGRRFADLATEAQDAPSPADIGRVVRDIHDDVVVAALKLVPAIHPVTREIAPLDAVARAVTERIRAGGDLGDDPVSFGYRAMARRDWLTREARIVPLPDGSWASVEQAASLPLTRVLNASERGRCLDRVREEFGNLRAAYEAGDPSEFAIAGAELHGALSELRRAQCPAP
jgi:hypothetical protein